ncbi:hypothetical protein [Dysgonomonas sp. ZJ709]|uniref:hypothetical protein n=1 Tax=Dysgonomonas sp. ZJ709 TaxID=2709797 RepID=UPI0013ED69B0|nr:hypothetical protein [Dysgonomonas sp. ZJ709]
MKRLYYILLAITPLFSFGQQYVLTPNGLADSMDITKDYLVITEEDKTADELYEICRKNLYTISQNTNIKVIGEIANEYIRYSMEVPTIAVIKKLGVGLIAEAYFDVEIRFKDGRIRHQVTNLRMPFRGDDMNQLSLTGSKWGGWAVFDKKGNVSLKDQKLQIENYFNQSVADLLKLTENDNNDDW